MPASADIAAYLAANLTGGHVVGTDIFSSQMPDAPDTAICVYQTGGLKPYGQDSVEYPGIQIIVRAAAAADAEALANQILLLLKLVVNVTIGSHVYHYIEPQGSFINMGQDDKLRVACTISFICMKDME